MPTIGSLLHPLRAALLTILLCASAQAVAGPVAQAPASPRASSRARAAESFDDFFTRFRQDRAFQVSRIRFPLPWYSHADEATRQVAKSDWEFQSFYTGQETRSQIFDNFAMRLADTNERVYALIGVASDIRQNYFFRRENGQWFLVGVKDLSM